MEGKIIYNREDSEDLHTHYFFIINHNRMFNKIKQRARKAMEPVTEETLSKGRNYEFWRASTSKEGMLPVMDIYHGQWHRIPGFYQQSEKIAGLIEKVENGEVPEKVF